MFKKYVSNTTLALGTSYLIDKTDGVKGYRVYIKPTLYGKFKWRFFFINSVNSTYAQGEVGYANKSGGKWKIHSATIGISASLDNIYKCGCIIIFQGTCDTEACTKR